MLELNNVYAYASIAEAIKTESQVCGHYRATDKTEACLTKTRIVKTRFERLTAFILSGMGKT